MYAKVEFWLRSPLQWQSGFVDVRTAPLALPELVMETSQEHQGPSAMQSTMEPGGTKKNTELGRVKGKQGREELS